MFKLGELCTRRTLWLAAAGSFVLILCVGAVVAAPKAQEGSQHR